MDHLLVTLNIEDALLAREYAISVWEEWHDERALDLLERIDAAIGSPEAEHA